METDALHRAIQLTLVAELTRQALRQQHLRRVDIAQQQHTQTTTTTARGDNLGTLYAQDFNFNNNTFDNGDCNYGRWNGCGQV